MSTISPTEVLFSFPELTEAELRAARLRSFGISVCVAVLPFAISIFWRAFDGLQSADYFKGVPDIAFAGVVMAIAAFSNTVASFVKLRGWKAIGSWTFRMVLLVSLCSLLCFVAYLRAAHATPTADKMPTLFFTALMLAIATAVFSFVLQYCFLSDECRWAREAMLTLPRAGRYGSN
jgi:hypothetical protein